MHKRINELRELSEAAVGMLRKLDSRNLEESRSLALRFFDMLIRNNEAIAILIDQGYYNEAYVIHRLSIEHLFNIFALIREKDFLRQIKHAPMSQISKALKGLAMDVDNSEEEILTSDKKERLASAIKYLQDYPPTELGYSIYNAARASEVGSFYNSVYRVISLSYAHSTYLSATTCCDESEINSLITNAVDFLRITMALIEEELLKTEPGAV